MPGPPLQQLNMQVVVPPFTTAPVADSAAAQAAQAAGAAAAAGAAKAGAPARTAEQSPTLYIAIGLAVLIIAIIAAFALSKRGAASGSSAQ